MSVAARVDHYLSNFHERTFRTRYHVVRNVNAFFCEHTPAIPKRAVSYSSGLFSPAVLISWLSSAAALTKGQFLISLGSQKTFSYIRSFAFPSSASGSYVVWTSIAAVLVLLFVTTWYVVGPFTTYTVHQISIFRDEPILNFLRLYFARPRTGACKFCSAEACFVFRQFLRF